DPPVKDDKADKPKTEAAQSPSDQYRALSKEFDDAMLAFEKAYRDAKTDDQRRQVFSDKYPEPQTYAKRFLALAEAQPKDPAALDALLWVALHVPYGPLGDKAMARLAEGHADSPKIATVVQQMASMGVPAAEPLFRAGLKSNPSDSVKAWSTFGLAMTLKQKNEDGGPDADKNAKEAESLFQKVIDNYAAITAPTGKLADLAKQNLHELQHLRIGLPAPDIKGEDIGGKTMKLSDFKGKVVMIDFWGHW
ncbi:MAG TPA: hypothetical protein VGZ22_20255, partial [Isosphaeraceae bacterium]|nr:hypothetical protein [Isosphaeraceae bacterium]